MAEPEPADYVHSVEVRREWNTWRGHAKHLYNFCITHTLKWPALTLQWLPGSRIDRMGSFCEYSLILGTQTSGYAKPFLDIVHVRLPYPSDIASAAPYSALAHRVEVHQRIPHPGDMNRARYMPRAPGIIATKAASGEVLIFETKRHPAVPDHGAKPRPQMRLTGHDDEGFALNWSTARHGFLASGAADHKLCVWDINSADIKGVKDKRTGEVSPSSVESLFSTARHTANVGDVQWHPRDPNLLMTAGDDKMIMLWDLRTGQPSEEFKAHKLEVNSVAFNQTSDFFFISGSTDKTIRLWDTRKLTKPVYSFYGHTDEVYTVQWSPSSPLVFASGSKDRRVMIWDVEAIGANQSAASEKEGPPELLFIHGGHSNTVGELSWNEVDPWLIASTADDNLMHVWSIVDPLRERAQ
eukprot:TRINITY_DN2108_c0_g1_i3.p1 TRINITY_DN2108_c0_g1~~TRINITY_DN2108_c0_g1_i3.p1  ORF type:complete len:423 (+),score=113.76 TRINITY_DN2108_c0_g1_i3:39-1271(+)